MRNRGAKDVMRMIALAGILFAALLAMACDTGEECDSCSSDADCNTDFACRYHGTVGGESLGSHCSTADSYGSECKIKGDYYLPID